MKILILLIFSLLMFQQDEYILFEYTGISEKYIEPIVISNKYVSNINYNDPLYNEIKGNKDNLYIVSDTIYQKIKYFIKTYKYDKIKKVKYKNSRGLDKYSYGIVTYKISIHNSKDSLNFYTPDFKKSKLFFNQLNTYVASRELTLILKRHL